MLARAILRAWRSWPPARIDAGFAVSLAAVAAAEIGADRRLALMVPTILLLAWRRRAASIVAVAAGILLAVQMAFFPSAPEEAALAGVAALVILTYSAAAYSRSLLEAALSAAVLAVGGNWDLVVEGIHIDDFWPFRFFFLGAAWGVGRLVLAHKQEAQQATARAERLEEEQDARTARAIARERARLARELHDLIAHNVSVMVVQAGAAQEVLAGSPERTRQSLENIQRTGRQTVTELRRLLGILRETDQELLTSPQPTLGHLDALVGQIRGAGLSVEVTVAGTVVKPPASLDLSAYRIVQEALTNVLKHARATSALVSLRYGDRALEIEVEDDGHGAAPDATPGHGLAGMRERVTLFGGSLEAANRNGGGYRLRAVLPFDRTA